LKKRARKAKIEFNGVLLQKELEGKEIIIGGKQDPQFGAVVLFGLGGIFVELMKDVSLKIAPVTHSEANKMLKSIKGYPVLKGMRGEKEVNLRKIIETIVSVSQLINEHPEIKELDLNPLIVSEKYCKAVDLRIIC
jgi:acetyl-CoA synthetase (ADP-forming)